MLDPLLFEQLGELRAAQHVLTREHTDAHAVLDAMDIPRRDRFQGEYTLAARLELVRLDIAAREIQLLQARRDYDILSVSFVAIERRRLRLEAELAIPRTWQRLQRVWRAARAWNTRTIVHVFRLAHATAPKPETEHP